MTATTPLSFSLPWDPEIFDVQMECNDRVVVCAHRHVLESRSTYYKHLFNSGQATTFSLSSHCFKAMLQYFYTGCIRELEVSDIDSYSHYIVPLYKRALLSRYSGLGGLDDYLTDLFVSRKPATLAAALQRLRMAWDILADLSKSNEPPEQCVKMQESGMQRVLDQLKEDIRDMPLSTDAMKALPRSSSYDNVLEFILRDVPLNVPEIEVCEALHAWAVGGDAPDVGSGSDSEDSSASVEDAGGEGGEGGEKARGATEAAAAAPDAPEDERLLRVAPGLLRHIDLSYISAQDLCTRLPELRLFPKRDLIKAKKELVLKLSRQLHGGDRATYMQRSDVNQRRGATSTLDPGDTVIMAPQSTQDFK